MKRPLESPAGSSVHLPSKSLGQNFLTDKRVVQRIIKSLGTDSGETIVEIGPGQGALTGELVQRAGRVIAIEFDQRLIPTLNETFSACKNFTLIKADALVVDFCSLIWPSTKARLVANLPYNISTAILQSAIEQRRCFSEMVVMLQREVVDRIVAPPGSKERGYLSVLIEAYCEAEKLFDVGPGSFKPAPKVWSSVVRLTFRNQLVFKLKNHNLLWELVSAGFAQRRKTIFNNLRNAPEQMQALLKRHGGASIVLCQAGIDLQRRAETLSLAEWGRIAEIVD